LTTLTTPTQGDSMVDVVSSSITSIAARPRESSRTHDTGGGRAMGGQVRQAAIVTAAVLLSGLIAEALFQIMWRLP
jgi:hypothetical protein